MLRSVLGLALLLSALACVGESDTGPFECPDSGDRFIPAVLPTDTISVEVSTSDWVCEGHVGYTTDDCRFWCSQEICADGYVGEYCVDTLRAKSWASDGAGGYRYGFEFTGWYDAEQSFCDASCTPGYEESK